MPIVFADRSERPVDVRGACRGPFILDIERKRRLIESKVKRGTNIFLSRPGCKGKAKLATRFSGYLELSQIYFLRKLLAAS